MRVLIQDVTNPYYNLATEEFLLKNTDDDIFMLWRNSPSIIVGRNQNTLAEINLDYVRSINLPVVRRLTGGGAVFHDLGNINYTFIESNSSEKFGNYAAFSKPILKTLESLGINAALKGRNDLCIDGLKFSGNAQVVWHNRIMHHGTLLFSADVTDMSAALKINELKIKSKGIKSVRSRVTNISEHLHNELSIEEFCSKVIENVTNHFSDCVIKPLDADEKMRVEKLTQEKYSTWEWNYGFSKQYSFYKESRFDCGLLQVSINIEENRIKEIRIEGDYFGRLEAENFENSLIGTLYDPNAIESKLYDMNVGDYFAGITVDQMLSAML